VSFVLSGASSGTSGSSCGCHLIQTIQLQFDLVACLLFNPCSSPSSSSTAAAVAARSILALHLIAHAVVEEEEEVNDT
jgi:hypothetical protein